LSDYFKKDHEPSADQPQGNNPWQQDPFATYDDPANADEARDHTVFSTPAGANSDYSAWRRPAPTRFDAPAEEPAATPDPRAAKPAAYQPRPYGAPTRPAADNPDVPEAYRARPQGAQPRPDFSARPASFGCNPPAFNAGVNDAPSGVVSVDVNPPSLPYGGGFAMPTQPVDANFAAMGADAPTRIARPINASQTVSKHKTVDSSANNPFAPYECAAAPQRPAAGQPAPAAEAAPEAGATRHRRVARAARYEENPLSAPATFGEAQPAAVPELPAARPEGLEGRQRPAMPVGAQPPALREGLAARQADLRPRPDFDPFQAGDSETDDTAEAEPNPAESQRPMRRPAVPGERYSGARTAMPQSGMATRRDQADGLHDDDEYTPANMRPAITADRQEGGYSPDPRAVARPQSLPGQRPPVRLDENGRPIAPPQGQRPQAPQGQRPPVRLDENGRPIAPQGQRPQAPQGQRPPVRLDENGRPIASQGMPSARPQPRMQEEPADPRRRTRDEEEDEAPRFDPRRNYPEGQPRASVNRPRYDFEEEVEEEEPPRRGKILIPLLVVLLVIGGLLAGVMLPDWSGMNSGLGTAMGKIKTSLSGVMTSVKGLISPSEEGIKSFTVSPTSATAPVELVFNVQASSSVTDIRILNQDGTEILSKTLTDSDMLGGEVTKNSNYNIWTLRYTSENAYSGVFTAQNQKKDGTWAEGVTLEQPVSIAPPVVAEPPVQDFETDTTEGTVPATVGFTVVTSLDVTAVQIVNDYGDSVAEAYLSDAGDQVMENGETRTWTLSAQVTDAYTGSFYAAYETDEEISFTQSDYSVDVTLTAADETVAPAADVSSLGDEAADTVGGDGADVIGGDVPEGDQTAGADGAAVADDQSAQGADGAADAALTADAGAEAAKDVLTNEPSATEAAQSTTAPEATPEPTPLPLLTVTADEAAAPSAIKLTSKIYEDTKLKDSYERAKKIVINEPFKYAVWDQSGVLTFRGDPLRQNAAFGTVEISAQTLTEMWKVPVEGNIKAKSATLTGVGWPGQPIIVKWPTQLRAMLDIKDEAKNKQALKEAIVGAQNGKIYFIDLVTGEQTRDPIANDWPSNGAMSLDTNASPMLAVGQHIGVLAKKTIDNGLHLLNLLTNKELTLLKGKEKLMQSNYSGFNGSPVFDKNTGAMVVGGENGLLYTVEPGDNFDHIAGTLKITPVVQKYSWLAAKEKAKNTNIDGSVAMYGSYAYFGDQSGIVQCVDVNTLTPMWAVDTGDNVDATVALDMENDTTVALYTGNTILNQGRTGVCTIRRLDALTGKQAWAYTVPDLTYTTEAEVGCVASPVVGQHDVSNLVFFTVTAGTKSATVYALDKATGAVAWSLALGSPTVSSPVAVYNAAGKAWLVQAESNGKLHLIDASSGTEVGSLQLEGNVVASPAVYRDVLVIGTTGSTSYIYGIKLE